jgi:hypothetical protein
MLEFNRVKYFPKFSYFQKIFKFEISKSNLIGFVAIHVLRRSPLLGMSSFLRNKVPTKSLVPF